MTSFREFAPAKINLTLEVEGRLSDGFHRLASLTTFASVGDSVHFEPGTQGDITISGPFAHALDGRATTLDRVLDLVQEAAPSVRLGRVHLEKNLPVAAGVGGGSADAGAILRAIRRADPQATSGVDWHALASRVGADVPVCLASRPLWMTGVGHELAEIPGGLPSLAALLVNPQADVPGDKTARVFKALGAGPVRPGQTRGPAPTFKSRDALIAFMRARGNDLQDAVVMVVPEVRSVIEALSSEQSVEHVAVSGAGPTCFGIFTDADAAERARQRLMARHPKWWIVAVSLLG